MEKGGLLSVFVSSVTACRVVLRALCISLLEPGADFPLLALISLQHMVTEKKVQTAAAPSIVVAAKNYTADTTFLFDSDVTVLTQDYFESF